MRQLCLLAVSAGLFLTPADSAHGRVVINEIFYNAPDDIEELEYVEVHNTAEQAVDLSGWTFQKGVRFKFPPGTRLAARGYLVLCRNADRFHEYYSCPVAGVFLQHLSNKGERLELVDPAGKVVDSVKYQDASPWPTGPNGASGSLERICPDAAGDEPFNWASSPLSKDRLKPAGTPGAVNASYSPLPPPIIAEMKLTPQFPTAQEPIRVEAIVRAPEGVTEVLLRYQVAGPGYERAEVTAAMVIGADGRCRALIPGQAEGQLVRARIDAVSANGARRIFPSPTEPRPAFSAYVRGPLEPARVPFGWIVHTVESEFKAAEEKEKAQETSGGAGAARGGYGPGTLVAPQALAHGDKNNDGKLSAAEFAALAEVWFNRLDPDGAGKLSRDEFTESLGEILPAADVNRGAAARARGGQRGGGARAGERGLSTGSDFALAPPWFAALDADKDGSLSKEEWKAGFARLFKEWGRAHSTGAGGGGDMLDQNALALGWSELLLGRKLTEADRAMPGATMAHEKFKAPSRGLNSSRSAFIYFDPRQGGLQLFDFIQVTPRARGFKVHLSRDAALAQMTTLNFQFENERASLVEPLAYEVYRRAGVPTPLCYHVRLWVDGRPLGCHLLVEQPNRAFLRRNKIPDEGNLYKLLWEESGVVGQHEKRTHARQGHDDVLALLDKLAQAKGSSLSQTIQENFDVDEVAGYFAVGMVLSDWEGFYNNYLAYHDAGKNGKWSVFPWDQNKTWGIVGAGSDEVFATLPLTFGMDGAPAPAAQPEPTRTGANSSSTASNSLPVWWHPGGYFSRPLLADSAFRPRFLGRTREILETLWTEAQLGPMLNELAERLRPEITWHAQQRKEEPTAALAAFEQQLRRCREYVQQRREYLLSQSELQNAPKISPTTATHHDPSEPTPKKEPGARKKTKAPK